MAVTIPCTTTRTISLGEFVEYVRQHVSFNDDDSVASAAPMLRALANDRSIVVTQLNKLVETAFGAGSLPSSQSILLHRSDNFIVRANVWPSTSDLAAGRVFQQDQFSYNVAHDHNFSFLTVNYEGPGYETDLYEYDPRQVEGYLGEAVSLQFIERARLAPGMVMLYRASRDVHIQHPPAEMSLSLNLMVTTPEVRIRDQFAFDLTRQVIIGHPPDHEGTRRASMLELAGLLGDDQTHDLLIALAQRHPCRRTRLSALMSLERLAPDVATKAWETACNDPAPLVAKTARQKLAVFGRDLGVGSS